MNFILIEFSISFLYESSKLVSQLGLNLNCYEFVRKKNYHNIYNQFRAINSIFARKNSIF